MSEMTNMTETTTTITLSRATVEKLKRLGHKGDTYEDIIQRLLSEKEGATE